jgi:hypothetical protein
MEQFRKYNLCALAPLRTLRETIRGYSLNSLLFFPLYFNTL